MADGGYDGSIKINTKIDSTGFNQGTKKMTGGLAGVMASVKNLGASLRLSLVRGATGIMKIQEAFGQMLGFLGKVGAGLAKAFSVGALALFGASLMAIMASVRASMGELFKRAGLTPQIDEITARFEELKMAVANAFLPLVIAALPYIKQAITWLTDMFNKVAMITAAFMGQKQVMQIVAGSAKKIADNTKKAAKEAKNALAAFDQINVLQKPDEPQSDITTADTVLTKTVPITDEILANVQKIKDEINGWLTDPWGKIQEYWGKVSAWFKENVTDPIVSWWEQSWLNLNVVEPLKQLFDDLWKTITDDSLTLPEKIQKSFEILKEFLDKNFLPWMNETMNKLFPPESEFRKKFIDPLSIGLYVFVEETKKLFSDMWKTITDDSLSVPEKIKKIFNSLGEWFDNTVGKAIREALGEALEWAKTKFNEVFGGFKPFARDVLNSIIGFIETMAQAIVSSINTIIDGINSIAQINLPGFSIGTAIQHIESPQIPRLATGAVIPPNSAFMAILGDQKSGTNIEAPADLIRQIVREELRGAGGNGDLTANLTVLLDGEKIYQNQQRVAARRGNSLVKGYSV